jgi:hypothetical protein
MSPSDFGITETRSASSYSQKWHGSKFALDTAKTGTLDLSAGKGLVADTVLKDGVIPNGVAVGPITGTSPQRYGLFDPAATDGRSVLAGFVLADVDVTLADNKTVQASGKAPFALLDRGDIKARFLPVVAQRTQLTYETATRGQFNFLTA